MKKAKTPSKFKTIIPLIVMLVIVSVLCIFCNFFDDRAYSFLLNDFNLVFTNNQLAVHFVDVGQGDGIAVNLPNGKTLLIDSAPPSGSSAFKNYIKDKVISSRTNNDIDYLLLTHADEDHIGGALTILKNFDVGLVFLPTIESNTIVYNNMMNYIKANNIAYTYDYSKLEQEDVVDVYTLDEEFKNTNDACPLVKIEYNGSSFLFTGDIPSKFEQMFVDCYGNELDVDILKVAHHGSKNSSCDEFLDMVSPEYAVISCGVNNKYKHPDQEALDRIDNAEATILRTDKMGNIMFVVGNKYGFKLLTGKYSTFGFEFKFLYLAVCVDVILIVSIVAVALHKQKGKNA